MAYNIKLTNGDPLTTINNGSVDSDHTSLNLVGKNFTGYGEIINENFVHLLENFANSTEPPNPITGQLWYDTTQRIIKVRTADNKWKTISSSAAGGVSPENPVVGDLWFDTVKLQLKGWDGSNWTIIGPAAGPIGYTGSRGERGFIGETGATGPQGNIGERGPTGLQGLQGIPGPVGPTGPTGLKGDPGLSFSSIINNDIVVSDVNIGRGPYSKEHNTRVGRLALNSNVTGDYNTAVGSQALYLNVTGEYNTSHGALG